MSTDAKPLRKAVIVNRYAIKAARELFPDHYILHPGDATLGYRWDVIVVAAEPRRDSEERNQLDREWFRHTLTCKLAPGGKILTLV